MNWRKWIRPALAVSIIAAPIAVLWERGTIERDLEARVGNALVANGQNWAIVSASADEVTVSGVAPAADAQQVALRIARGVSGVRAVSDRTNLPPIAAPYVWSARLAGRQVTLSGSVPSDGERAALLAAARRAVPQAEIIDHTSLARGSPSPFIAAAAFAVGRLAGLSDGLITLSDATLSVSGTAVDASSYAGFRTALAQNIPPGVEMGAVDVLPPRAARFVWSVNLDNVSVTSAGDVPNEIVRDALEAAIKAAEPGLPTVDAVTIASGDPPGFAEAASYAVTVLQHLQRGGVTLDGVSLDVAGVAKSVDDYDAVLNSLSRGLPKGMTVLAADITPATVSPYFWRGDAVDAKVALSGYVPSVDARTELSAFAKTTFLGAATIDDQIRVAAGGPRMDWVGAVKFAVGELALLGRGSVAISANTYAISGEAKDAKAYSTILDQTAHPLPAGLLLKTANVLPPRVSPYRFSAQRRDGGVVLSGYVGNDSDRQTIVAAAQRVAGAGTVTSNLVFASGAADGFAAAAAASVRALTRLSGGKVDLVDQSVSVSGTAYHEAAVGDIDDALHDALPAGFMVVSDTILAAEPGQPLTAGACRDQLQAVVKAGGIQFDANNPVVTTDSLGILDRVASTMLRCPAAAVEVGVYSDNDGSTAALRDRTQARADAIVDYLATAGVQRERLTAVGYGSAKPVADNSTPAGQAANRRVEFTVAVPAGG